jgi:hypothetical protein
MNYGASRHVKVDLQNYFFFFKGLLPYNYETKNPNVTFAHAKSCSFLQSLYGNFFCTLFSDHQYPIVCWMLNQWYQNLLKIICVWCNQNKLA